MISSPIPVAVTAPAGPAYRPDPTRGESPIRPGIMKAVPPVEPQPRSGPGIQARIVLEDDDRLDDGIEGRAAGFQHGEPSRPRPIRRILRRGIRSGPAMREEDRAHAPGTEEVAFNFSAAF